MKGTDYGNVVVGGGFNSHLLVLYVDDNRIR
jgi:hypothetical protein